MFCGQEKLSRHGLRDLFLMEMVVDRLGQCIRDTFHRFQVRQIGPTDRFGTAKMGQQSAFSSRSDARDIIQRIR